MQPLGELIDIRYVDPVCYMYMYDIVKIRWKTYDCCLKLRLHLYDQLKHKGSYLSA